MPKCSYCGENYEFPRGLTLVDTIGKVRHLCSSKCHKYTIMGRKKGKWATIKTKEDRAEAKKERDDKAEKAEKENEKSGKKQ